METNIGKLYLIACTFITSKDILKRKILGISILFLDSTCIMPGAFKLWVLPVHYEHLWKIRAPLVNIQGRVMVLNHF